MWKNALSAELSKTFPAKVEAVRDDPYGIAVFCRSKIASSEIIHLAGYEWPTITCAVPFGDQTLKIYSVHIKGPLPMDGWTKQANLLSDLATKIQTCPSAVVCGDFNMVPWATNFRRLLNDAQLCDTRAGFGLQCSWPSERPIVVSKLFKLPIKLELFGANWLVALPNDHCLVGKRLTAVNRQVGPFVGSDHFPVCVDLVPATDH
jgi:endonuclease/exonuclease/phosphatase (EEP) superfamily protein YafD